jgi:DnaA N-terminal domain
MIEQSYRSQAGRLRRRAVTVDLDELRRTLRPPALGDVQEWERIRERVAGALDASTFAIWVEPLELVAVDRDGALLLACPERLAGWVGDRFLPLIARGLAQAGREVRLAEPAQLAALRGIEPELRGSVAGSPRAASAGRGARQKRRVR